MPLEFSSTLDGAALQLRVTPNQVQKSVLLEEHPHRHSFVEFHYIFSGEERVLFPKEKKALLLKSGQMILIPPDTFHCAETEQKDAVCRLCFHFHLPEKEGNTPLHRLVSKIREPARLESPLISASLERCRALLAEERSPLRDTREGVILLDVILDVLGRFETEKEGISYRDNTKLRQRWLIEEYIGTRYHAADGLKGLANKLYLSQRQTRKLVRQFFGEDYKALIIRQRMEMAQILLESNESSLEEIGESVGYRSYSGFHLAFVRSFGLSPGEYRRQKKK